jgi:predicted metal-binding membrane protein
MPHIARTALWLSFFAAILAAWWVMFSMAQMMGVDWIGRPAGMMSMGGMSDTMSGTVSGTMPESGDGMGQMGEMPMMQMTSFGALFPMWAIMMAAMMLPTMVPTLRAYEDLMVSANGTRAGWVGVILGYFVVWVGFAAVITGAQIALMASGLIDDLGISNSLWFAGLLFGVVGLFQFTRAKEICHGVCHSPGMYFLGHWKTGFAGGLRMGLGLGAFCVGCCWGFMALGFVGGVMSLLWMGLATLFMVIEKLPQIGHYVTKPMGVVLILTGVCVAGYGVIA